jgi:predicted transcriptional regulator
MKRSLLAWIILFGAFLLSACGDSRIHSQAVYMLVDTSGTYTKEINKAAKIISYLLATLNPGDSLAVAKVETRSFTEKDIISKVTFDRRPSQATQQKRAFKAKTIVIFSDMQEELGKGTVRDFPIKLDGIRIVALNVSKLGTDNADPRLYLDRLSRWKAKVLKAGATEWVVVNDLDNNMESILSTR